MTTDGQIDRYIEAVELSARADAMARCVESWRARARQHFAAGERAVRDGDEVGDRVMTASAVSYVNAADELEASLLTGGET